MRHGRDKASEQRNWRRCRQRLEARAVAVGGRTEWIDPAEGCSGGSQGYNTLLHCTALHFRTECDHSQLHSTTSCIRHPYHTIRFRRTLYVPLFFSPAVLSGAIPQPSCLCVACLPPATNSTAEIASEVLYRTCAIKMPSWAGLDGARARDIS